MESKESLGSEDYSEEDSLHIDIKDVSDPTDNNNIYVAPGDSVTTLSANLSAENITSTPKAKDHSCVLKHKSPFTKKTRILNGIALKDYMEGVECDRETPPPDAPPEVAVAMTDDPPEVAVAMTDDPPEVAVAMKKKKRKHKTEPTDPCNDNCGLTLFHGTTLPYVMRQEKRYFVRNHLRLVFSGPRCVTAAHFGVMCNSMCHSETCTPDEKAALIWLSSKVNIEVKNSSRLISEEDAERAYCWIASRPPDGGRVLKNTEGGVKKAPQRKPSPHTATKATKPAKSTPVRVPPKKRHKKIPTSTETKDITPADIKDRNNAHFKLGSPLGLLATLQKIAQDRNNQVIKPSTRLQPATDFKGQFFGALALKNKPGSALPADNPDDSGFNELNIKLEPTEVDPNEADSTFAYDDDSDVKDYSQEHHNQDRCKGSVNEGVKSWQKICRVGPLQKIVSKEVSKEDLPEAAGEATLQSQQSADRELSHRYLGIPHLDHSQPYNPATYHPCTRPPRLDEAGETPSANLFNSHGSQDDDSTNNSSSAVSAQLYSSNMAVDTSVNSPQLSSINNTMVDVVHADAMQRSTLLSSSSLQSFPGGSSKSSTTSSEAVVDRPRTGLTKEFLKPVGIPAWSMKFGYMSESSKRTAQETIASSDTDFAIAWEPDPALVEAMNCSPKGITSQKDSLPNTSQRAVMTSQRDTTNAPLDLTVHRSDREKTNIKKTLEFLLLKRDALKLKKENTILKMDLVQAKKDNSLLLGQLERLRGLYHKEVMEDRKLLATLFKEKRDMVDPMEEQIDLHLDKLNKE